MSVEEFEAMNQAISDYYDRLMDDRDFEDKLQRAFQEIDDDFKGE